MIRKKNIITLLAFFFIFIRMLGNNSIINFGDITTGVLQTVVKEVEDEVDRETESEEEVIIEGRTNETLTNIVGKGLYNFAISEKTDPIQRVRSFQQPVRLVAELTVFKESGQNLKITPKYQGGFEVQNITVFCKEKNDSVADIGEELVLGQEEFVEMEFELNKTYEITMIGEVNDVQELGEQGRALLIVEKEGLTKDMVSNQIIVNDTINESGLVFVEKTVDKDRVFLGELVQYTIRIKNSTGSELDSYVLKDYLPAGLEIIPESPKVPEDYNFKLQEGMDNIFEMKIERKDGERIKQDEEFEMTYIALVKVLAKVGRNTNLVKVNGMKNTYYFSSNTASASIEVESSTFASKGIIFGRVYIDENKNKIYDEGIDITVPGVRILLENGDYMISDVDGKYSIYGQNAITHIAKVDMKSVPKGMEMYQISNKHSENGESVFINLKTSQLHKVNFAFVDVSEEIKARIEGRREILKDEESEIERLVFSKEIDFRSNSSVGVRARSSGAVDGRTPMNFDSVGQGESEEKIILEEPETLYIDRTVPFEQLETVLTELDNTVDFINVQDGDTVQSIMTFQIKGPRNGVLNISINGEVVPLDRIGMSASSQENNLFFLEYNAVAMNPGVNKIEATYSDPFGNIRGRKEITVKVAGEYSTYTLTKYKGSNDNSEETGEDPEKVYLLLEAKDQFGNPINHDVGISIYADKGTWASLDDNKDRVGIQMMSNKSGMALLEYYPVPGSKTVVFNVDVEGKEKEFELPIVRKRSKFYLNGILEGQMESNKEFAEKFTIYESPIQRLQTGGNELYSYRSAVYGEGYVYEDYHLTIAYDNVEEDLDKAFGYVDPEEYFLVYGDNAIKGYQAKSASRFFTKLEKEDSYLLYGDYDTSEFLDPNAKIGKYSRALTGIGGKYVSEKIEVSTFYAEIKTVQRIDKFRGNGTSGPYRIDVSNIVEGSEKIELIVYQSGTLNIEMERKQLQQFEDYTIDYDLGDIYFSSPIQSVDENFNPIYIEINYEVDEAVGKPEHPVYGANLKYKIKDDAVISLTKIEDEEINNKQSVHSIGVSIEKEKHKFYGEYGITKTEESGEGEGAYLQYAFEGENIKGNTIFKTADENFDNSNAQVTPQQHVLEGNLEYKYNEGNTLKVDTLIQRNEVDKKHKTELYLGNDHKFSETFSAEAGYKFYHIENGETMDDGSLSSININTLGVKLNIAPEKYKQVSSYVEYEQDIFESNFKRMGVGGRYEFENGTGVYVKHELFSELQDQTALNPEDDKNRWLVGVEGNILGDSKYFSEYRLKKANEDELPEVGTGVKSQWEPIEKIKFRATFERIEPLLISEADDRIDTTALTFGFDYRITENIVTKSDIELAWGDRRTLLLKNNYGQDISNDLFIVGKNRYYENGDEGVEDRFILGVAYRGTNDKYNSLNRYELNYSENIVAEDIRDIAHTFKTTNNYQLNEKLWLTQAFAVEYREFNYPQVPRSHYIAYLSSTTLTYDIFEKWNIGIGYFVIGDEDFKAAYRGGNFEIGYLFNSNIWLSVGYSMLQYPPNLYAEHLTEEFDSGFNVRIRMNIGDIYDRTRAWMDRE